MHVVVDAVGEGHQATGVDPQRLAIQLAADQRAAGVDEDQAIALELLQDEALAAEETGAQALGEGDADPGAIGCAEERVLLAEQAPADIVQVHRHHAARIGRGKGHVLLALAFVGEVGHEHRLATELALAGAPQLAQQAAVGAVAHPRGEADVAGHVVHRPGLGDHGFPGVEFDLHGLHGFAEDAVVEFVAGHRRSPCLPADRPRAPGKTGTAGNGQRMFA